jgi:hypothetical protein
MRGNAVEVVHDPTVRACIISKYLMDTLVGNKPLTPINRSFRNPRWSYLFPCRGITRGVPIIIDFHIYPIVDFSLLLGFPLDDLLDKSQGSLDEKLREAAPATTPLFLENSMERPLPKQNLLEEMMHVSHSHRLSPFSLRL